MNIINRLKAWCETTSQFGLDSIGKDCAEAIVEIESLKQQLAAQELANEKLRSIFSDLILTKISEQAKEFNGASNLLDATQRQVEELEATIAEQAAEIERLRQLDLENFTQHQHIVRLHCQNEELTAQRDELLSALENIAACPGDNRLTTAIQWAKAAIAKCK